MTWQPLEYCGLNIATQFQYLPLIFDLRFLICSR